MYIRNYFLKQPRRGKTREALITPHKRSAVWGLMLETGSDCGDSDTGARSAIRVCLSLIIVVLLALASPLFAQHRDTLYVVEEEPVYDTLFVHDTLRVCECTTRWSRRRRTKTNPKNGNQKSAIIMLLGWIMSFSPLRWSMTIRNITKWGFVCMY